VNFIPGFTLMALMFPTAVVAAVVGWFALRATPPNWLGVACAYAILLSPIVLGTVWWPGDGFQLAMAVAFFTVLPPAVGVALTVGVFYKRSRAK
jgi:hypothetical protein